MKKICYYCGTFFPKVPYLDYNIYYYLKENNINITFIIKKNDIRLKGTKNNKTLLEFNHHKYINIENLIKIENLDELTNITNKFDLFLCTNLAIDRLEISYEDFFKLIKTKKCILDVCGYDIIKKGYFNTNVDYFLVKGNIFKEWLEKLNIPSNHIYVTGSPLFDYCFPHKLKKNYKTLNKASFCEKYDLDINKKTLLITTTNLKSVRNSMNHQNYLELEKFYKKNKNKYNYILLSYPLDYLFYETKAKYRRSENKQECPDYQTMQNNFKNLKIIKVNDNYNALKHSNIIFHLSAGALSVETILLFNNISTTMHFKDKDYYKKKIGYSKFVKFPDDIANIHLNNIDELNSVNTTTNTTINIENVKNKLNKFIYITNAHKNMLNSLNQILDNL